MTKIQICVDEEGKTEFLVKLENETDWSGQYIIESLYKQKNLLQQYFII